MFELVRPLGYVYAALPMTFDPGTPRERHVLRTKIDGTAHRWTRAGGVQRAGARVRGVRSAGTA